MTFHEARGSNNETENRPVRDVHHPRKQLHEMCPGRSGFRQEIIKDVNLFESLVIFGLKVG
jgi:hypothetical protein